MMKYEESVGSRFGWSMLCFYYKQEFVQFRKRCEEYYNNHKNENHFLNACSCLENYLLVSNPTFILKMWTEKKKIKQQPLIVGQSIHKLCFINLLHANNDAFHFVHVWKRVSAFFFTLAASKVEKKKKKQICGS